MRVVPSFPDLRRLTPVVGLLCLLVGGRAHAEAAAGAWATGMPESVRPLARVRTLFVSTFEERFSATSETGTPLQIDSARMDPSAFGHREGFVLDSVELGLAGGFADAGLQYQFKFDLVPREKDGNRSSDYLKDAYVGWTPWSWLDLRVGRMKLPYSQVNMKRTEREVLIYKPTIDVLSQKRQLGAMVGFTDPWGFAQLRGGVFNSAKQAVEQMSRPAQLLYTGRLDLRFHELAAALGRSLPWLEAAVGVNVAWTEENFDPPTEHRWMGVDAHLKVYGVTLEAELLVLDFYLPATVDGSQAAERGWGWVTDLDLDLGLFTPALEGLSVAARVEQMDGDSLERGRSSTLSIDELSRQKKLWVTGGVRYQVSRHLRVDLNYLHRREQEGYGFDNDVLLAMVQFAL